eukprot:3315183-Amphidinium_carterae.1
MTKRLKVLERASSASSASSGVAHTRRFTEFQRKLHRSLKRGSGEKAFYQRRLAILPTNKLFGFGGIP